MSRIVVTGGAGFLGSHLCRALLDRGDRVVAVDNLVTGSVSNVEELFGHRGFTFVEHDVSQYVWVPGPVDVVMHFASPASPIDFERIPIQILKVGGLGTHNCLGLAKAKGATFFLASTSEVYGDPQVHPQPESYWGHVNPIGPRGVYDEAKRYAEALTMAYHRHHGVDVRIVRIFNSILADEQVLYDDGTELRREPVGDLAARLEGRIDLHGYAVPGFDTGGAIGPREATALVGHPTSAPCFEIRTGYGRSVRVTGDHSLFVEGPSGAPVARTASDLAIGDRIAIAGRIDVVERDRTHVSLVEMWDAIGDGAGEPHLHCDGRGDIVHELGGAVPGDRGTVRPGVGANEHPAVVEISDELLWLLGVWVAAGDVRRDPGDAVVTLRGADELLERASKVFERELGAHVVRTPARPAGLAGVSVRSTLAVRLWEHLGFDRKRIPGWILGLPLARLKWFVEGYREGVGAHGDAAGAVSHELTTASDAVKDDLIVALSRFGLCPSVGRAPAACTDPTGGHQQRHPRWRLTLSAITPWSPLDWDRGVTQHLEARRTGDIVWAPITEIVPVDATPLVYDFCVPGFENFWAGTGVCAHNTYGPRMRVDDGRSVSNFLVQALRGEPITVFGDGSQTRSFCYVDDEIRGFLALLDSEHAGPVNIGNPNEFTIKQLAELAVEVTGSSSTITYEPLPVDDPSQRQPDLTLARTLLGWEPTIPLRTGLERTADHFRRVLGRSTPAF